MLTHRQLSNTILILLYLVFNVLVNLLVGKLLRMTVILPNRFNKFQLLTLVRLHYNFLIISVCHRLYDAQPFGRGI